MAERQDVEICYAYEWMVSGHPQDPSVLGRADDPGRRLLHILVGHFFRERLAFAPSAAGSFCANQRHGHRTALSPRGAPCQRSIRSRQPDGVQPGWWMRRLFVLSHGMGHGRQPAGPGARVCTRNGPCRPQAVAHRPDRRARHATAHRLTRGEGCLMPLKDGHAPSALAMTESCDVMARSPAIFLRQGEDLSERFLSWRGPQ